MSDDDCDIFNVPVKRANAVPQSLFVSDQDSMQTDYDFIEITAAVKKPLKVDKLKAKTETKTVPKRSRRENVQKEEEESSKDNNESSSKSSKKAQALPERDISPVSQLIHEMELSKVKALVNAPIARRTRSSLGKSNTTPEKQKEDTTQQRQKRSPKRRAVREKNKTTDAPIPVSDTKIPRRNRRQVAEIAAYSKVLDSIDLISAVAPRVEGFVNLESDDEDLAEPNQPETTNTADVFDDDNPLIDVNLSWLGEMQMYKLRQHQKFSHMFKEIAKRNNVPVDDIVIIMDDHFIDPNESPENVGLKIYHILSGRAIESNKNKTVQKKDANLLAKPRKFQLKVQGDKWKTPLVIPMKRTESFKLLYIKCAEEMECDVRDLKLFFDGELLELDDTPKNQDMEGNEMIDVRLK